MRFVCTSQRDIDGMAYPRVWRSFAIVFSCSFVQEQAKLDAEFKLEYDRIEAEKRQEMHEAQMTAILVQRQIEEWVCSFFTCL